MIAFAKGAQRRGDHNAEAEEVRTTELHILLNNV